MREQLDLFSEGDRLKEEGMARVLEATPLVWKAAFVACAERLLAERGAITDEEIIAEVGFPYGRPNAVGACMNGVVRRLGLVRKGERKSTRPSCHSATIKIWGRD
jgi:hypothetical protein